MAALPEPEQHFWLRKAEELGWSRNHLRGEVRASLEERRHAPAIASITTPGQAGKQTGGSQPGGQEHGMLVKVTSEQLELFRRAASKEHLSIQAWAAQSLDRAARTSLRDDYGQSAACSAALSGEDDQRIGD